MTTQQDHKHVYYQGHDGEFGRCAVCVREEEERAPECIPEFIDGSYYGCGDCQSCVEDEQKRREEAEEYGESEY
ncbi:hypothetical protein [Streptomyces sp. NPDC048157]|uniref:hypothetical protein n=1 Tax=Streptomyces sp. NPDC048157 TaxID=3365503 RepID=UPI0037125232